MRAALTSSVVVPMWSRSPMFNRGTLQTGDCQVLTKGAGLQHAPQLSCPPVVVALAIDVHSLVWPAMVSGVADEVICKAQRRDGYRASCGALVYAGDLKIRTLRLSALLSDIHAEQLHEPPLHPVPDRGPGNPVYGLNMPTDL